MGPSAVPAPTRAPATGPNRKPTAAPDPQSGSPSDPQPPVPTPAPPPTVDFGGPFDVGLIGDTGYDESQEKALLKVQRHMNTFPLAFTVHDGDIWSELGGVECTDANYTEVRNTFNGFAAPFMYTPGDNEWTDCPSGSDSAHLAQIRRIFFPDTQSLGQSRMAVARQDTWVENARWTQGGVVFFTLNVPGPADSGSSKRKAANTAWLNAAFDEAEAMGAVGVVAVWQDNPFEQGGAAVGETLKKRAKAFARPVVLVHGDTHNERIDHPWKDLPSFTRVETFGDTNSGQWIRMTVDPNRPEVFSFRSEKAK